MIPTLLSQATNDPALGAGLPVTPKTFWLPEGASTIAPEIDWIFNFINYINYFFFVLVVGIMFVFMWKYRQRGREVYARGPNHHTMLELGWTIIPTIIVVFIFFIGFKGFIIAKTVPDNAYQIDVTAAKWYWKFKYPNGATSDDLYVPAGRPVKLVLRSEDVLHSFYIRDFRVKQDVVPGRYTSLWFQADNPTEGEDFHHIFCTEFCGTGHSDMNRKVFVLPETEFDNWVVEQGRWLDKVSDEDLWWKAGPQLYRACASCHTLDGSVGTGPSWGNYEGNGNVWERTKAGSTHKIDGGKNLGDIIGPGKEYETPEGYLRESILNPGKHLVDPYGNVMPTFKGQLSDRGIQALIDMMKNLDKFNKDGTVKPDAIPNAGGAAGAAK
jgi:cytochrome c oxidase subunit 2